MVSLGAVGNGTHSWKNQNKYATDSTDFTDLSIALDHALEPPVRYNNPFESVESVESVAFLLFGPIRSESGGKLRSPTSHCTQSRCSLFGRGAICRLVSSTGIVETPRR